MSTPTTFEAHGQIWQIHTPGNPMPCNGNAKIAFILRGDVNQRFQNEANSASRLNWDSKPFGSSNAEVIGWRYATAPQEKNELTRAIGNLLAQIHYDGGHHEAHVGTIKAIEDAQSQYERVLNDRIRLGEENASMRTAIKEGYTALEKALFVHKAITTYAKQSAEDLAANMEHCGILAEALATLSPFTESK